MHYENDLYAAANKRRRPYLKYLVRVLTVAILLLVLLPDWFSPLVYCVSPFWPGYHGGQDLVDPHR